MPQYTSVTNDLLDAIKDLLDSKLTALNACCSSQPDGTTSPPDILAKMDTLSADVKGVPKSNASVGVISSDEAGSLQTEIATFISGMSAGDYVYSVSISHTLVDAVSETYSYVATILFYES